jgi:hypothetical protein
MRFMTWFVRVAGFYNAGAIVVFLTPGAPEAVGLRMPEAQFWVWLPAPAGLFVVVLAAGDVPLALVTIFGLPNVLRCGHGDLLRNRVRPIGAVA